MQRRFERARDDRLLTRGVLPPERVGLLASERDRRFGETALTFYRREEDR